MYICIYTHISMLVFVCVRVVSVCVCMYANMYDFVCMCIHVNVFNIERKEGAEEEQKRNIMGKK